MCSQLLKDQIQSDCQDPKRAKGPWNPNSIFGFIVIISSIGVGIALGLNWKRLGKPEWRSKTILLAILIPLASISLALGWLTVLIDNNYSDQIIMLMPFIALGANVGFPFALAHLQNGAYKIFQEQGLDAIKGYEYNIRRAVLLGIGITILTVIFGIFILPCLVR